MRNFRDNGEVWIYLACAIVAALMIHDNFSAERPPWFFWVFVAVSMIGVVRIFHIAWGEDRKRARDYRGTSNNSDNP